MASGYHGKGLEFARLYESHTCLEAFDSNVLALLFIALGDNGRQAAACTSVLVSELRGYWTQKPNPPTSFGLGRFVRHCCEIANWSCILCNWVSFDGYGHRAGWKSGGGSGEGRQKGGGEGETRKSRAGEIGHTKVGSTVAVDGRPLQSAVWERTFRPFLFDRRVWKVGSSHRT